MRRSPLAVLALALATTLPACGGTSAPPIDRTPLPDLHVSCQPNAFSAGAGCATSACTVTSLTGFSGSVTLSCERQPAGLTCAFGPNPLAVGVNGITQTGFAVASDSNVPPGVYTFDVVATGGGLRRTGAVTVQTDVVPPPRPVSSRSMVISGCAGYAEVGPQRQLTLTPAIVGAWRDRFAGFCRETHPRNDGRFDLEVPPDCVPEGHYIYLTAGGMGTCVAFPFVRGGTAHAIAIGSRRCTGP